MENVSEAEVEMEGHVMQIKVGGVYEGVEEAEGHDEADDGYLEDVEVTEGESQPGSLSPNDPAPTFKLKWEEIEEGHELEGPVVDEEIFSG